jgi:Leucine-rich repeat (LRR) protein
MPVDRRSSIVALAPFRRLPKRASTAVDMGGMTSLSDTHDEDEIDNLDILYTGLGLATVLREFYIGENRLKDEAMEGIQYLLHLQILNLSYNALYEIGSVKNLSKLRELYISGNHLTALPEDLDHLALLKVLFVNGNKLVHLPAELARHHQLTVLDASDNQLSIRLELEFEHKPHILEFGRQSQAGSLQQIGSIEQSRC